MLLFFACNNCLYFFLQSVGLSLSEKSHGTASTSDLIKHKNSFVPKDEKLS